MIRSKALPLFAAAAAVLAVAAGAATASPEATSSRAATVKVADSDLGRILVDSHGRTLYLFKKDTGTKSACYGQCAEFWPPLRPGGKPKAGRGARASMIGTTKRRDGSRQVTYNGHPLYGFAQDTKPGDTNGEGVKAFGARWWAVSPAGTQVIRHSPSAGGAY
jgi:predicted lipoprotein with Yx(FWY)xxD motif